jgi:Flp pilus assembly protein TadD
MQRDQRNIISDSRATLLASVAAAGLHGAIVSAALVLCGCQTSGLQEVGGSIRAAPQHSETEPAGERRRAAEEWGRRYDRHPDDKATALNYATALRGTEEYAQAASVLQRLAVKFPRDMEVLAAYGKALANAGRLREAAEVLPRAHSPDRPNWSILSAQGSVADLLGDHEQAQAYYASALKIAPAQPHVLSNLGLSYALSKKLPEAEKALQEAAAQQAADARVRQNLSLVLALEGKFDSAETVARSDLTAKDAASNVTAIRRMVTQSHGRQEVQTREPKPTGAAKVLAKNRID